MTGCKPDKPSPEAMRASLLAAVEADNAADTQKLIDEGADANSRTSPTGWSALHFAARDGNVAEVQLLLQKGADPNYSGTMDGQTGNVLSFKPLTVAQASLDLVNQIPPAQMAETLRQIGLSDPALLKSVMDPTAKDRYQQVVALLTKVTTN